jgi:glycosyltransferase involved in cell wall biosynthesis
MIDIVIPVEAWSSQLDRTIECLERHTTNYMLHVEVAPDLNVAEARQKAMDNLSGRYLCFLDYDSEMIEDDWLGRLFARLESSEPHIAGIFPGEWWGEDEQKDCMHVKTFSEIDYGPAACMLLDRERIPAGIKWNGDIGLRNGYLGGDMEELHYCVQFRKHGMRFLKDPSILFHHTGGRTTMAAFTKSDRCRTVHTMIELVNVWLNTAPDDADWFRGLRYVRAESGDHNRFAPGGTVQLCYGELVKRHGLYDMGAFQGWAE